jgi:hypothetical protein
LLDPDKTAIFWTANVVCALLAWAAMSATYVAFVGYLACGASLYAAVTIVRKRIARGQGTVQALMGNAIGFAGTALLWFPVMTFAKWRFIQYDASAFTALSASAWIGAVLIIFSSIPRRA